MKNYKINIGLTLILISLNVILYAQNQRKIDSLHSLLIKAKEDTCKFQLIINYLMAVNKTQPDSLYIWSQKGLDLAERLNHKNYIFRFYKMLGYSNEVKSDYNNAIFYYLKALRFAEKEKLTSNITSIYMNIANVYYLTGNTDDAIHYYTICYNEYSKNGDNLFLGRVVNNLGNISFQKNNLPKAREYYLKSLNLKIETNDKEGIAYSYNNLGLVSSGLKNHTEAVNYFMKALEIRKEIKDVKTIGITYSNIASEYFDIGDVNNAQKYANMAIKQSDIFRSEDCIIAAYLVLSKCYEKKGAFKKALEYYTKCQNLSDSIESQNKSQVSEMKKQFEKENSDNKLRLLKKEKMFQIQALNKQKQISRLIAISLFLAVCVIIVVVFYYIGKVKSNRILKKQKKEIEEKNSILNIQNVEIRNQHEEISAQRDEIEAQRDEIITQRDLVTEQKQFIEQIHEELTDSIKYALRIQNAILPSEGYIKERLNCDFFILNKPKDIVSGDFYFVEKRKHMLLIAVADCTGHGVPGAFMSMLGISFLNEIIAKENIQSAAHVLDELRQYVIQSLQQKGVISEQKDGMDIIFISINVNTNELHFAGANNPLFLIHAKTNELIEINGNKMPVAIYENMSPFTNHVISLQKGDTIYLTTDGYKDQFGGPNGKKFLTKNLKILLLENGIKSMNEQKEILNNTIENWKNNYGKKYEQTDDITVLGIKI